MIDLLQKAEQALALLGRVGVVILMAIALIFTVGQAIDRYGVNTQFDAHDQIAQLALVWLTFVGYVLAVREGANVRVDLVDGLLTRRLLHLRNMVSDILIVGLLVLIQFKIWRLVELGAGQAIIGTPFSSDATYLALATSSALGIVMVGVRLLLGLIGREPPPC